MTKRFDLSLPFEWTDRSCWFIRVAQSISQINIIVFNYSEQFIADVTPYFLRAMQFGLLCRALLDVRNYLILKGKQHTFGTFGQISKLQGKQYVLT